MPANNNTPTGIVAIAGIAKQGETLSATNTLADEDGIPASGAGAISYQWLVDGVNLVGATAATLTLAQAQVGKEISVVAQYTDSGGTAEKVSAWWPLGGLQDFVKIQNLKLTQNAASNTTSVDFNLSFEAAKLNGSVIQGAMIDLVYDYAAVNQSEIDSPTALNSHLRTANVWTLITHNLAGATATGKIGLVADLSIDNPLATVLSNALSVKLNVSGLIDQFAISLESIAAGGVSELYTADSVIHSIDVSPPRLVVLNANDLPTGGVTISGKAVQGQTLTASNSLADADGIPTSGAEAISYQWRADAKAISGATSSTFVLTQAEVGKLITVTASYTDSYKISESQTSGATAAVTNVNDAPTGSVTIGGTPTHGQTLTAANTLADVDGLGTMSYQWQASANGSTDWRSIESATSKTLVLSAKHIGNYLRVVASYTDGQGTAESQESQGVLATTSASIQAYVWKSHTLLSGVALKAGTYSSISDKLGAGSFANLTQASLSLTASRTIPTAEASATTNAVNLQDAIAILKMIVGLPVNGSTKGVANALSPYQALAADFNADGEVSLQDAIGVLKLVVGLSAPQPSWHFLNELDASVAAKATLKPGTAPSTITADLSSASPVHVGLVAYLSGDVDGSYAGATGASDLDITEPSYFVSLVANHPGVLTASQFGG